MPEEYREGDWVRYCSCPEPVRVVGVGATIVVQFPNRDMQAFEPCELEKVAGPNVRVRKQNRGRDSVEMFVGVTFVSLLYLLMLVWFIARTGR
jgi:hypothetical protein